MSADAHDKSGQPNQVRHRQINIVQVLRLWKNIISAGVWLESYWPRWKMRCPTTHLSEAKLNEHKVLPMNKSNSGVKISQFGLLLTTVRYRTDMTVAVLARL